MASTASDPKKPAAPVTGYPAASSPPAAAAYAYPAPSFYPNPPATAYYPSAVGPAPPPPYYPPPAYPNSATGYGEPDPYSAVLVRRLVCFFVVFFLFFAFASFVVWLAIRPRLPEFSVASVAVSDFNLTSDPQQLSAKFDLGLTVHNPNVRASIYYDRVWSAVEYGSDEDVIADVSLPPFYQDTKNTTTITAHIVAAGEYVDSDIVKGINSDRGRGDGAINFQFRFLALTMFRAGIWQTRWHTMRVYCDDVQIVFKNTTAGGVGSLADFSRRNCLVNI